MKKLLALLLAALLLMGLCSGMALGEEAEATLSGHLVILHTNDSHGRVNDNLGFGSVAFAKKTLEAAGATVLLLDAGDTLYGLPFATVSEGASVIELMNAAGYDAMTPGNHDFNYGYERLTELSNDAAFPIISANVAKADGEMLLPPYVILERDYFKIGIFGLSTPETTHKTNPLNVESLAFNDPIAAAREQVAALEAEGCSIIIALSHLGISDASEVTASMVAQQVEGIDLIIDGHSHTALPEGMWVGETLIVSAGEYIENIGCVDISPEGEAMATLLTADDLGENDSEPSVDQLIGQVIARQDSLLNVKVGETQVDLDGARETVRAAESNLANLLTDAMRQATGADVAIVNGGSLRESIPAGEITKKQIAAALPFGNYAVTLQVTGEQLLAVLEEGVKAWPELAGSFPQVSGMSFKFDGSVAVGSRVYDVQVGSEPLDPAGTYLLVTNDYVVAGGDYQLDGVSVEGEFSALDEILIDYIGSLEEPVSPAVEGRIVEAKKAE